MNALHRIPHLYHTPRIHISYIYTLYHRQASSHDHKQDVRPTITPTTRFLILYKPTQEVQTRLSRGTERRQDLSNYAFRMSASLCCADGRCMIRLITRIKLR